MTRIADPPIASTRLGLSVMRSELNRSIVGALAKEPMTRNGLKAWLVLGSASTLHRHLDHLQQLGLTAKHDLGQVPRRVEYELTASGKSLAETIRFVEMWLGRHPDRPLEPTSPVGWRAFAALGDAWESHLVQRLAPGARSEAELLEAIVSLGDEKLERELQRLVGAGLFAEVRGGTGGGPRYSLTEWCRRGLGALAMIARWERVYLADRAAPVGVRDGVIALLATLPLICLDRELSGRCSFTIEGEPAQGDSFAPRPGIIWAEIEAGSVRACAAGKPRRPPEGWARGKIGDWLAAAIEGRPSALHIGGSSDLVAGVVRALHRELFCRRPSQ